MRVSQRQTPKSELLASTKQNSLPIFLSQVGSLASSILPCFTHHAIARRNRIHGYLRISNCRAPRPDSFDFRFCKRFTREDRCTAGNRKSAAWNGCCSARQRSNRVDQSFRVYHYTFAGVICNWAQLKNHSTNIHAFRCFARIWKRQLYYRRTWVILGKNKTSWSARRRIETANIESVSFYQRKSKRKDYFC